MTYLPIENITYKTRLTEEELIKRLEDATEPARIRFGLFGKGTTKTYEGEITPYSFSIRRIIWFRNSFLPEITGTMLSDFHETRIYVKMRLHPLTVVLTYLFCGVLVLMFVIALQQNFDNMASNLVRLFGMFVFLYALTMGAFKLESIRSKTDLQKLFEAEMVEG